MGAFLRVEAGGGTYRGRLAGSVNSGAEASEEVGGGLPGVGVGGGTGDDELNRVDAIRDANGDRRRRAERTEGRDMVG